MEEVKKPTDEKPTATNEQLDINSEATLTDKAPPEAAALAQDNQATQGEEKTATEKNDKVVTYDFNQKDQTLQSKSSEAQEKPPQGSKTAEAPEKPKEEKPPENQPTRRGRPPNPKQADNPDKKPNAKKTEKSPKPAAKPKPKPTKEKTGSSAGGGKLTKATGEEKTKTEAVPETPPPPPEPTTAPRTGEQEQIVYINLTELHPFKDHPFQVKQDAEMAAMVESVKDKGVTQPAIVRPREEGGYELESGHRRQLASELANYTNMPCIVRDLTDEQAITQMVEDNTNQRDSILPSERGAALKMQLEAIKRQGARDNGDTKGQRSNEVVAERNGMTVKQVQRYIKLTELVPDLSKMVDEKKIAFTPAVELAHIKPKNQDYIAVAIEGNSAPSLSQAQRLRELDKDGKLNPDIIDGVLMEEKKEADKVILSSKELSPFFGKEKTPREMKDTILKLLNENKKKNPPELGNINKQVKPPER